MECPTNFSKSFWRVFIPHLNGDFAEFSKYVKNVPGGQWVVFATYLEHYPALLEKAERFFSEATHGDPCKAACAMASYCGSSFAWARSVIENAECGDPPAAAYFLVTLQGATRFWAERVIQKSECGDPSSAAYNMVSTYGASAQWAQRVIENDATGTNVPDIACKLASENRVDREWAEKVIECSILGDRERAAESMVEFCGSSLDWKNRIIANSLLNAH